MPSDVKVAVIGAGPSGLSVMNAFRSAEQKGETIPSITCFDKQDDVSGLWNYSWRTGVDDNGEPNHNSMYRYLWSNAPKECLELADFPFVERFGKPIPSFPPREVLRSYFMGRVKKNGLLERFDVRLSTIVRNVEFVNDKFQVVSFDTKTQTSKTEIFDYVIVASGHFSMPNLPDYPGLNKFPGRVLHAHDFRDAREFAGEHVLIVGSSYSAEDIALQCVKYGAKNITCSYRTKPMGFKWPDSIEELQILTTIEEDGTVNFSDGSKRKVDAIIFCTGYRFHFSFLPDELRLQTPNILYPNNLYKGVAWQQNPKCFFIGMQDQCYTYTLFDMQAFYIRNFILGKIKLPNEQDRAKDIKLWHDRVLPLKESHEKIDFQTDYMKDLMKEIDYPKHDLDKLVNHFHDWLDKKQEDIVTYRDQCYESVMTGHMAARHHSRWMDALDDSLESFMKTSS